MTFSTTNAREYLEAERSALLSTDFSYLQPFLSKIRVSSFLGQPVADSRVVAASFSMRHSYLLRKIRRLHCESSFRQANFMTIKTRGITFCVFMTHVGLIALAQALSLDLSQAVILLGWEQTFRGMNEEIIAEGMRKQRHAMDASRLERKHMYAGPDELVCRFVDTATPDGELLACY